ncbi:MAG: amidohydrolase family protein [Candidatus Eisenbacteria bacterium]
MKCACWPALALLALMFGVAASAPTAADTPIVLRDVMIFDPATGSMQGPQDVLIEGSRISEVGRVRDLGQRVREIQCDGKYAVAGLFDCHTHLAHLSNESDDSLRVALAAFAASGITQVRDVGGPIDVISRMSRRIAVGEIAGPEIFYAGPMLEASPLTWERVNDDLSGFTVAVDTPRQADSILSDLAGRGATLVKTFNKFDREVYRHLVEAAARCSLKVVHDPGEPLFNAIPMDFAIDLGVKSIEHAKAPWPVILRDDLRREHDSLLVSAGTDEARMAFMMKVAERDTASVSKARLRQLGEKMMEQGVCLCPTLQALMFVDEVAMEQVKEQMQVEEVPEMVPVFIRKQIRAMQAVSRLCVRELAGQGVRILVGQDGFDAADTFVEMRLLKECGVSETEIIKGATIYPAAWLGVDDRLGSIAPGKEASLLVVTGNPLEDIGRLASPSIVIQKGRVLRP